MTGSLSPLSSLLSPYIDVVVADPVRDRIQIGYSLTVRCDQNLKNKKDDQSIPKTYFWSNGDFTSAILVG